MGGYAYLRLGTRRLALLHINLALERLRLRSDGLALALERRAFRIDRLEPLEQCVLLLGGA